MDFKLNELQKMIVDSAKEYTDKFLRPNIDEIESSENFPKEIFDTMAEMGFIGVNIPEQYGGIEAGYLAESILIKELSKVSGSAGALLTVTLLPLEAILLYGNDDQKKEYITDGVQGKYRGSFAFTEAGTGSDPKQLTTTYSKVGDKYIINGAKRFISNAAYEGPMILFAKAKETDDCTAFIIDKFCKGYTLSTPWEKIGLHGSNIYDVFLDNIEVEEKAVLGQVGKGFDILIHATTYGKLSFSSVFTGLMEGAYNLALTYVKEKMHRGKSIGKFPTIQDKIARIAANVQSAELMLYKAALDADEIKNNLKKVQYSTSLTKGYIADLAVETNIMCMNVMASYGVTAEYKVERFLRDSLIGPNIEGAADMQRLIAGSYLIWN